VSGITRLRRVVGSKPGVKGINQPLTGFCFCLCHSRQSRLKHLQLLESTAESHRNDLRRAVVRTIHGNTAVQTNTTSVQVKTAD